MTETEVKEIWRCECGKTHQELADEGIDIYCPQKDHCEDCCKCVGRCKTCDKTAGMGSWQNEKQLCGVCSNCEGCCVCICKRCGNTHPVCGDGEGYPDGYKTPEGWEVECECRSCGCEHSADMFCGFCTSCLDCDMVCIGAGTDNEYWVSRCGGYDSRK